MKTIHDQVNEKAKVKVNISVKAVKKKDANLIKGKPIEGIQHIIAVASGKGGVGKSTVTANLAVSLSNMGFKVGVLDADIYGPSMPIMFDVANERPLAKNIDGVSKMVPVANFGVKLLSIGFFTKPDQAVIWRGPMAAKALNRLGSMMSLHFTVPSLPMTTRPEVFIFPSKVPSIRKSDFDSISPIILVLGSTKLIFTLFFESIFFCFLSENMSFNFPIVLNAC